ncbi:hypothetical protein, partial [Drancourtella massiliensis]|uniref:hypothetical protein n=1 Tax=Drancourtella massiliensis TaxID=1632013 RepID=UPI00195787D5
PRTKVSSLIDAIFAFCVLYFISDTSLFHKIFTNPQSQQILFYSEVSFFLNHLSRDSLYLNYTGSSLLILCSCNSRFVYWKNKKDWGKFFEMILDMKKPGKLII